MEPGVASSPSPAVVVDANIALGVLLELTYSEECAALFERWLLTRTSLYAPMLWDYEIVSGLRKSVAAHAITSARAHEALEQLQQLGVNRVPPDVALNRAALRWSERLSQNAAYDAEYVALAEFLGAELWTADRRLAARASSIGATFVHCLLSD